MKANHPLRRANWLWPSPTPEQPTAYAYQCNTYAHFRHDFTIRRVPKRAPFFITADQSYMLYVNGHYVARGPARGYQESWPFDEVDVSGHLQRGANWISIRVYNSGISTFQYLHTFTAGMLCAGVWPGTEILSGPDWLMRVCPAHRSDTGRLSRQMNFQEHVDARLDDQAWIRSARRPKSGWTAATRMRPFGYMPWASCEARGIPNLGNDVLAYQRTCYSASGQCAEGFGDWSNATDGFRQENASLQWSAAPAGRITGDALRIDVPGSGRGRLAAVSIDLGQPGVGTVMVEASGAAGGEIVDLFCTEALDDDGRPALFAKENCCGASMTGRLRLRPGKTTYEFFQMMGHRYLVAIVRDSRQPIRLKLGLRHCVYPFKMRGRFETDDQTINDIYRISVNTQRVCALDSYVDTPWREQAQWWGDARVQAQNTFHISGDTGLLVRGIRQIAQQEVPNGLTYGHARTVAHNCILPDFSMIWAITIWDYYYQTGDVSLFVEQWPRIQRLMPYFTGEGRGRHGLLRYDERFWLFLDWCDLYKEGTPTLLNLWYVIMLDKLAELAGVADMGSEKRAFAAMARDQKRLVLAKLFDRRRGLFRDGIDEKGKPVNTYAIHNQTLAIMAGLADKHTDTMVDSRLMPYLKDRKVASPHPSAYWVTYVYDVMRRLGYGRAVVEHIRRHWAPMIPYGGVLETFGWPVGVGTASHAWSAHPIYHLTGEVGGIVQADVAWRRITFAPMFDVPGVNQAKATVPTPHGLIRSSWRRTKSGIDVSLTLPKDVRASVQFAGRRPRAVTGRHTWCLNDNATAE